MKRQEECEFEKNLSELHNYALVGNRIRKNHLKSHAILWSKLKDPAIELSVAVSGLKEVGINEESNNRHAFSGEIPNLVMFCCRFQNNQRLECR